MKPYPTPILTSKYPYLFKSPFYTNVLGTHFLPFTVHFAAYPFSYTSLPLISEQPLFGGCHGLHWPQDVLKWPCLYHETHFCPFPVHFAAKPTFLHSSLIDKWAASIWRLPWPPLTSGRLEKILSFSWLIFVHFPSILLLNQLSYTSLSLISEQPWFGGCHGLYWTLNIMKWPCLKLVSLFLPFPIHFASYQFF